MNATPLVAVVAGVGPALGASLVRALAAKGYVVAALARQTSFTTKLAEECAAKGQTVLPVACDLTNPPAVATAFTCIANEHGPARVLIYNAHQLMIRPFLEIEPEGFERVWRVGCAGAMLAAQQAIPRMISAGGGTIIFTGATAALRGGARFAAFASAKFALRGLAQALAREFGPQGVHVAHVIIDGLIWGEPARELHKAEEARCLKPEAIADAYMQIIDQDPSAWTHELDLRPAVEKF